MKKLLLCIAVLCLSACIPVKDFGTYWEKGSVDPALLGKWMEVDKTDENASIEVANDKGTYRIESLKPEERTQKDYKPSSGRTLKDGSYTFVMFVDGKNKRDDAPEKDLVRYDLKDGILTEYDLIDAAVAKFLNDKYPKATNITSPRTQYGSLEISVLDEQVYGILAAIPDTPEYWKTAVRWKKVP